MKMNELEVLKELQLKQDLEKVTEGKTLTEDFVKHLVAYNNYTNSFLAEARMNNGLFSVTFEMNYQIINMIFQHGKSATELTKKYVKSMTASQDISGIWLYPRRPWNKQDIVQQIGKWKYFWYWLKNKPILFHDSGTKSIEFTFNNKIFKK